MVELGLEKELEDEEDTLGLEYVFDEVLAGLAKEFVRDEPLGLEKEEPELIGAASGVPYESELESATAGLE